MDDIVLVTESDRALGGCEKLYAHQHGLLHRAFSIFIHQETPDHGCLILLQKRHPLKYHSGNLWTNACCSHPRVFETIEEAAHRRLKQEMGFETQLDYKGHFTYHHQFPNGLIEHEFDHVFTGSYSGDINPDPHEVSEYRWISFDQLQQELVHSPQNFTPWFKQAFVIAYQQL